MSRAASPLPDPKTTDAVMGPMRTLAPLAALLFLLAFAPHAEAGAHYRYTAAPTTSCVGNGIQPGLGGVCGVWCPARCAVFVYDDIVGTLATFVVCDHAPIATRCSDVTQQYVIWETTAGAISVHVLAGVVGDIYVEYW